MKNEIYESWNVKLELLSLHVPNLKYPQHKLETHLGSLSHFNFHHREKMSLFDYIITTNANERLFNDIASSIPKN